MQVAASLLDISSLATGFSPVVAFVLLAAPLKPLTFFEGCLGLSLGVCGDRWAAAFFPPPMGVSGANSSCGFTLFSGVLFAVVGLFFWFCGFRSGVCCASMSETGGLAGAGKGGSGTTSGCAGVTGDPGIGRSRSMSGQSGKSPSRSNSKWCR